MRAETKKLLLLISMPACLFLPAVPALAVSANSFDSGMNCYGVWKLPDTGQTVHYSTAPGDDSDYRPAATQPRYTVLNPVGISSVTVDNVTGLMWITNPQTDAGFNKPGASTWDVAISSCEALNYAGYTDWRLPNIRELISIVDYGTTAVAKIDSAAFFGAISQVYWSGTTHSIGAPNVWHVQFNSGIVTNSLITSSLYVRCVRAGQ